MTNAEIVAAGRATGGEFYWYHIAVVRELERLYAVDAPSYPLKAIAENIRAHGGDVLRWLRELQIAGIVKQTEPAWDYDGLWFGINPANEEGTE